MVRQLALTWTLLAAVTLPSAAMGAQGAAPADHGAATEGPPAGGAAHRQHQVIEFDPATAIWVLIIFLILLAILYPTAWKNVLAGLKAREERIRKDIADAEAARAKAEATLREYNTQLATAQDKVREMIAGAVRDGEKVAADIRAKGQSEAEEAKNRATRDIEAASKQAITEIYAHAADLSTSIASKILRRNINPDDQRQLVQQSLDELQSIQK